MIERRESSGQFGGLVGVVTMAEARLAPAIQVTIHEMVRHYIVLSYKLMAFLAFPQAIAAVFHLFDYYTHLLVTMARPSPPSVKFTVSIEQPDVCFDTFKRRASAPVPL